MSLSLILDISDTSNWVQSKYRDYLSLNSWKQKKLLEWKQSERNKICFQLRIQDFLKHTNTKYP